MIDARFENYFWTKFSSQVSWTRDDQVVNLKLINQTQDDQVVNLKSFWTKLSNWYIKVNK